MNLDVTFVIASCALIACLIPLYIYREKIFKLSKPKGDFDLFVKDIKLYLNQHHPKIKFDFSIIDKTKDENDIKIRETIIVETLISQFCNFKYEKNTQSSVAKNKLWALYEEKSIASTKTPTDWQQRRELVWNRDYKCCNRCAKKIPLLKNAYTQFVRDINLGGGYNIENIILLCQDCNMILNSQENSKKVESSLEIYDKLMMFVKS